MELMDAIRSRHSVRKFTAEPVSNEVIRDLVECAMLAPTAGCMQAWRFVAATDPAVVKKIKNFSPGILGNPAAIIALCSDIEGAQKRLGMPDVSAIAAIDASLAAENLMLRATELGVGTCAIKSYNDAAVRKILGLPETVALEFLIIAGYPEAATGSPARKPVDEVLFFDKFPEQ